MDFEVTPNVTVDYDDDGNLVQLSHRRQRYSAESAGLTTPTPVELAEQYVGDVSDLYGINDRERSDLAREMIAEPMNEQTRLKRSEVKPMMETTVVSYQQTYRGLPIWNATFNVVIHGDPPEVTSSYSTLHKDVQMDPPSLSSMRGMADEVPATMPEALGIDDTVGEDFAINGTNLLVYQYDPDERYDPASQPQASGDAGEDEFTSATLQQSPPTLPLPPIADSIESGQHYVVREVLFSLTMPEWGELNWRAFVETETGSVLYLRAFTAAATCCVFANDPVSTTGDLLTAASPAADLDAARTCGETLLGLIPPAAGVQALSGEFVRDLDVSFPTISPPTKATPFEFHYSSVTDDFAAASAYYHMDGIYRMVEDMGFSIPTYFDGTAADPGFPVPVDHRGKNSAVNADAPGNTTGTGVGRFRYGLVQSGQPVGIAATIRVCLHEFGHALLWDHVGSPNFGWCHSAGDTMAAVLCDAGSQAPDRFETFPFMKTSNPGLQRRHDRDVGGGWAWGGIQDNRQYGSEQILSTLMFRIYRVTGGDDGDIAGQRFAARYLVFLILKATGMLTTITTNPAVFVDALMDADESTISFEGHAGGAWHKLFRWSFEKQGLYQPPGAPTPVTQPGAPQPVDVYINDGRDGDYEPYLPDFGNTPDIWNRLANDGGSAHQDPVAGETNYLYVRVKNRGTATASNVVVKGFQGMPGSALNWPANWLALTTAQLPGGSISSGGETLVGPFEWTPIQSGPLSVLVSVSAPGDESNAETVNGAISNARLVPLDNNIAQRDMTATEGEGTMSFKFGSGSTTPGATNWQPYAANGIYLDVDTSACGFTGTPKYFTSLGGRSNHWGTTGATSIYRASATGFRVYVRRSSGSALDPAYANAREWHINWFAIEGG